jgi:lipopolysaccharide/colanic/teichoic acid biosynthesis glycosyltransferase
MLKRTTDIVFALMALLLISPVIIFIAILIKLEGLFYPDARGPIFRHETRISQGRSFPLIKFRFLKQKVLDEEETIRRRDRQKSLEQDEYGTRVGNFLKKFYLDEIPQLINILRGEMSWVGPRPFPMDDYEDDIRLGRDRKKVVPAGLTGLVQIHKGKKIQGVTDVVLDNEYVQNVKNMNPIRLWFYDLSIMLKTIPVIFQAKGL